MTVSDDDFNELKSELKKSRRLNKILIGMIGLIVLVGFAGVYLSLPIEVQVSFSDKSGQSLESLIHGKSKIPVELTLSGPDIPEKITIEGQEGKLSFGVNIDKTDTSFVLRPDFSGLIPESFGESVKNTVDQESVRESQAAISEAIYGPD